jgi:hypothetical protein
MKQSLRSTVSTEQMTSGAIFSISAHNLSIVAPSEAPLAVISRMILLRAINILPNRQAIYDNFEYGIFLLLNQPNSLNVCYQVFFVLLGACAPVRMAVFLPGRVRHDIREKTCLPANLCERGKMMLKTRRLITIYEESMCGETHASWSPSWHIGDKSPALQAGAWA